MMYGHSARSWYTPEYLQWLSDRIGWLESGAPDYDQQDGHRAYGKIYCRSMDGEIADARMRFARGIAERAAEHDYS